MTSRAHVQLGAFDSEAAAKREWQRLKDTVPALMAGRAPTIIRFERDDGHVFWRLRTWGFDDRSAADGFCVQLRPTSPRCFVFSA